MNLIAHLKDRLTKTQDQAEQHRKQLWAEYRRLLEKQEAATARDAERVLAILDELDIRPEAAELHAVVIAEHVKFRAKVTAAETYQHAVQVATGEIEKLTRQLETLQRKIAEAHARRDEASRMTLEATQAEADIETLESQYPGLFGRDEDAPIHELVAEKVVSGEIQEVKQRLRL